MDYLIWMIYFYKAGNIDFFNITIYNYLVTVVYTGLFFGEGFSIIIHYRE